MAPAIIKVTPLSFFIFKLLDYVFAMKGLDFFGIFFTVYSDTLLGTPGEIETGHCFLEGKI